MKYDKITSLDEIMKLHKGISSCYDSLCTSCPYHKFYDCRIRLKADTLEFFTFIEKLYNDILGKAVSESVARIKALEPKESECVVKETVEEFVEEDSKIVLKKKKVTNKSIPQDKEIK